jgi:hypothetical protein
MMLFIDVPCCGEVHKVEVIPAEYGGVGRLRFPAHSREELRVLRQLAQIAGVEPEGCAGLGRHLIDIKNDGVGALSRCISATRSRHQRREMKRARGSFAGGCGTIRKRAFMCLPEEARRAVASGVCRVLDCRQAYRWLERSDRASVQTAGGTPVGLVSVPVLTPRGALRATVYNVYRCQEVYLRPGRSGRVDVWIAHPVRRPK